MFGRIIKLYFSDNGFNPNKAGLFDSSFFWKGQFESPFHISRRSNLISM